MELLINMTATLQDMKPQSSSRAASQQCHTYANNPRFLKALSLQCFIPLTMIVTLCAEISSKSNICDYGTA